LGHDVTIIAPQVPRSFHRPGPVPEAVCIARIGRGRSIGINKTSFEVSLAVGAERVRLDRIMRSAAFDVVHVHTPLSPLLPLQALARSDAAKVATFHAVPPTTLTGPLQRLLNGVLNRRIIRKLDGVILASPVQKTLRLTGTVLPPCTNLRPFADRIPSPADRDGCPIRILFLGRLEKRKGAAVLLNAYAQLRRQGLPVRLLFAGDGPERGRLQRTVDRYAIPDVAFLGQVDHGRLADIYAGCDIFCAPSLYAEGFGIVLVEAMASGKPVVAAANAGYLTVLHGDAEQFLARPGDVADLSDKLRRLVEQPLLRGKLGDWGRREAARYDSDALAPAFLSVYAEAIRSRMRRAAMASH
jgi:phosphatidylinositol alpha-mannosyltransferase